MAAAEIDVEHAVEVSINVDTTTKKVALSSVIPQSSTCVGVCLTIFQIEDVEIPLNAAFPTQEQELMESLRPNTYRYGVWLRTTVGLASGKLDTVNFDSALEQRRKNGFLRTDFLLGEVHTRHGPYR